MLQCFITADMSTIFYVYFNLTYSELILTLESRLSTIKKFLLDVSGSFLYMFKVWVIHLFMKIGYCLWCSFWNEKTNTKQSTVSVYCKTIGTLKASEMDCLREKLSFLDSLKTDWFLVIENIPCAVAIFKGWKEEAFFYSLHSAVIIFLQSCSKMLDFFFYAAFISTVFNYDLLPSSGRSEWSVNNCLWLRIRALLEDTCTAGYFIETGFITKGWSHFSLANAVF